MSSETRASEIVIDEKSLLARVPASMTLEEVEMELGPRGLSLELVVRPTSDTARTTIGAWLAAGAPGSASSFTDPADHLVAGLEGALRSGKKLVVHPGPRRSVGPDLTALFVGANGRFGTLDGIWLRAHRVGARRASLGAPSVDLDPPLSDAEERLALAIAHELEHT